LNNAILVELARVWNKESQTPEIEDGSLEAAVGNARRQGERDAKRECADTLMNLIETFKD